MLTVMVSKFVGDALSKGGIYEKLIQFNNYPFLNNQTDTTSQIVASEVMTIFEDLIVVDSQNMRLQDLEKLLVNTKVHGFPILDSMSEKMLIGYIGRLELKYRIGISLKSEFRFHDFKEKMRNENSERNINHFPCIFVNDDINQHSSRNRIIDFRKWTDQTP